MNAEITPVELAQILSTNVHTTVHDVHLIGTVQGAETIRDAMDALISAAQVLRGHADRVLSCDEQVEAGAVFDDVMSHLDGGAL